MAGAVAHREAIFAAKAVFSSAAQSVVSIADFRIVDGEEVAEGTGSGLVWDRYGHVVTNYHCVAKLAADKRGNQVTMVGVVNDKGNTQQFNATIKGLDPNRDIAVLQINAPAELLRPLKVGTSADLRVGQSVFAIGNPLGFSRTLTAGVVSGLDRIIPSPSGTRNYGAIQTDAAISKGNSGGPLLDSAGRLVGINTATFTRAGTGRSSGVNFALPVDMVRKVVPNLIVYGNSSSKM
ncbi:hypothetical protein WJX72_007234 [[Myrmecia] bisecta]|uniref:Serine protease n=1 Tax=[Myrmecia] bisecta TaxID=41462 RepID=A0AAW1PDD6_9CHLO